MKKLIVLVFFLSICLALSAKQIDENTAKKVGENFLISQLNEVSSSIDLSLIYKAEQNKSIIKDNSTSINYFYIFNRTDAKGFVIVSADDIIKPILGYSLNNSFEIINLPSNISWWLQNYSDQIQFAIENNLTPSIETQTEWENLLTSKFKNDNTKSSVSQLLQTTWDQSPYYNDMCPYYNAPQRTVTGCAATAMAQIMKYWNYPINGTGTTPAYTTPSNNYSIPSVSLSTITYNWTLMPNSVTSSNYDVANLMYDCGVSVEMDYGLESGAWVLTNDQSGNHPFSAEHAYPTYFGYNSSTIQGKQRSDYTNDADWIALLENELNNGRPIQYAGWNSTNTSAHTWVCDGYDQNDYFHMNWGWSGTDNDYYTINLVNSSSSISIPYTYYQQAIIGIMPTIGSCFYTLSQNSNNFSSNGGSSSFNVNTSTNCSWTASTNYPWIHITSGSSGTGNGAVNYTIDANPSSNTLSGTITINGSTNSLTYNITVTGLNCIYSLNPTASNPFSSSGGTGSFSINTNSSCVWSAYSNNPDWLHITSTSIGTGNSSISYSVDPNLTTNTLTGTISVADQVYTVTENGASTNCVVTFPTGDIVVPDYLYNYSFNYSINAGCSYSALSSSPDWLTIISASNNIVNFQVSANNCYFPKTGYIYINSVYKKITQEGNISSGIDELSNLNNVNLYPNPAIDKLTIDLKNVKDLQNSTVSIYDIQGQLLLQQSIKQEKIDFNIKGFTKGVYVVKVYTDKETAVKKFIKE